MELNRIREELIVSIDDLLSRLNGDNFLTDEYRNLFNLLDNIDLFNSTYERELKRIGVSPIQIQLYIRKCYDCLIKEELNKYGKFDVIRTNVYLIKLELKGE